MIYISRINICYGGAELLMEKIAIEYLRTGFDVSILCSRIESEMENRFIKDNIPVLKVDDMRQPSDILKNIKEGDVVITFCFLTFMTLNYVLDKDVKILNYVITADEMVIGSKIDNKLIKLVTKSQYKSLLKHCLKNDQIVVMDQETLDITNSYYKTKFSSEMILLPYDVSLQDDDKVIKSRLANRKKCFNILSISRADMKMKAYLIDLIKHFPIFLKEHPTSKLEIVTFGEDIGRVYEEYNKVDPLSKKAITIHGMKTYEELEQFFANASVFIGMGTSVLDASNHSLISVPVVAYSNECLASHLFSENPSRMSAVPSKAIDAYRLLDRVYNFSDENYLSSMKESKKALLDNYDIHNSSKKLLTIVNKSKRFKYNAILTRLETKRYYKAMEVLYETGKM